MPPIFVDARELADRLAVGHRTVLSWVRRGKIPCLRDGRSRLLFNLDAVLAALRPAPNKGNEQEGRPDA